MGRSRAGGLFVKCSVGTFVDALGGGLTGNSVRTPGGALVGPFVGFAMEPWAGFCVGSFVGALVAASVYASTGLSVAATTGALGRGPAGAFCGDSANESLGACEGTTAEFLTKGSAVGAVLGIGDKYADATLGALPRDGSCSFSAGAGLKLSAAGELSARNCSLGAVAARPSG